MNILLLEDAEMVAQVTKHFLKKEHQVDWALNGIEGLDKMKSNIYDLALVDIMMPKMNGYEFIAHANALNSDMIYVAFTAIAGNYNDDFFFSGGFDAIIEKPFCGNELLNFISSCEKKCKKRYKYHLNQGISSSLS